MANFFQQARGASLTVAALLAAGLFASPAVAQTPAGKPAAAAEEEPEFKEAGFFALRLDFGGRRSAGAPVEVSLTARNYLGDRQGLQYNTNSFKVLGSNGVEYKWDGNYYGKSGAERLNTTVWLEKGEQGAVTYVFPGVPKTVKPVKLIIRDGDKVVGEFRISEAGGRANAAAPVMSTEGTPAGQPVTLKTFETTLASLSRGDANDLEAVVRIRNISGAPVRMTVANLVVALFAPNGETRYADGSFYQVEGKGRRIIGSTIPLAADEEVRVKLWFAQSARIVPARYKIQEPGAPAKEGPIPAGFAPAVR